MWCINTRRYTAWGGISWNSMPMCVIWSLWCIWYGGGYLPNPTGCMGTICSHVMWRTTRSCSLITCRYEMLPRIHDDVIKWKHFPRYWPFVRGIHRSPVNSPHKGQWRGALMFSLICSWMNAWVNNSEAGDLRRHRAHYDVIVMA